MLMNQPLDPLSLIELAQELAVQDGEEVKLRTAVNRAYYALFLIAREKIGLQSRDNVHTKTIQAIKRQRGYRAAGEQLDALRRLRTIADYELLPGNARDRDWKLNWQRTRLLMNELLPKLQDL